MEMQHKSSVQAIIYMIDNCGMSPSDIENKTKISRTQVYRWRDGTVKKVRTSSLFSVATALGFKIHHIDNTITTTRNSDDNTIISKGDKTKMEQQLLYEHIELLRDKVAQKTEEIGHLKELVNKKQVESNHWEALDYDFICNVTLYRDGYKFGRVINKVTDLELQAKKLGYSVEKMKFFWDVGVKHTNLESHPIDTIIDTETHNQIQKNISTMPLIFDAMKSVVGNHYIPQPIIYKHKNGTTVGAISYNKIEWKSLKVIAKVKFLTE